jgi:hypothetical protein
MAFKEHDAALKAFSAESGSTAEDLLQSIASRRNHWPPSTVLGIASTKYTPEIFLFELIKNAMGVRG